METNHVKCKRRSREAGRTKSSEAMDQRRRNTTRPGICHGSCFPTRRGGKSPIREMGDESGCQNSAPVLSSSSLFSLFSASPSASFCRHGNSDSFSLHPMMMRPGKSVTLFSPVSLPSLSLTSSQFWKHNIFIYDH